MALLVCSLAYLTGIMIGRLAWEANLFGCQLPDWGWIASLALLLPAAAIGRKLDRRRAAPVSAMRWPPGAGFEPVPAPGPSIALLFALGLCLTTGFFRYLSHPLDPCWQESDLAYYNLAADRAYDREAPQLSLQGYVAGYPLVADTQQRLHVRVTHLIEGERRRPVQGTLRLTTGIRHTYRYGQSLRLRGRLVTPADFEDFSYREFLARKGIHSLLNSPRIDVLDGPLQGSPITRGLFALRRRGEEVLNRLLPEPYAALANGMLLGIEAGIPQELYEQFNLTGTSHVIVISGSNVALIAAVMMGLGSRILGQRRAILPTLAGIACYGLLVGGDAAVMRATLMGGLFVYASGLGRRSTALVSLAAACWAMTLVNPLTLWDVGFQLSSAATAGLILFSTAVAERFARLVPGLTGGPLTAEVGNLAARAKGALQGLLEDGLIVTMAANLTTLPLVVYYFGRLSVVSLLTNLLISPVQPFIMLWGSAGILLGAAGLTLPARIVLWVPWLSLTWTVAMVRWTAALPGASLEISTFGFGPLLLTYLLIFGFHWRTQLKEAVRTLLRWSDILRRWSFLDWRRRVLAPTSLAGLCVASLVVWATALSQPDGLLHVHFLDIGQGDGMLIQTPSGRQVLIDGGAGPQELFSELGAVMPFWDRRLDMLLLSHPDADHMAAQVEVPARLPVDYALDTEISQANADAAIWRERVAAVGAQVVVERTGGWVDLGDGVALWVFWPPPGGFETDDVDNENSLVVKLVYGEFSALLTGDAGLPSEEVWLAQGAPLASTVLKVGHHGSNSSTGEAFLRAVNPALAVIQVGENKYGHPTEEILDKLAGRLVLRNDRHGRIHIWSDGKKMWVDTEKGDRRWLTTQID